MAIKRNELLTKKEEIIAKMKEIEKSKRRSAMLPPVTTKVSVLLLVWMSLNLLLH